MQHLVKILVAVAALSVSSLSSAYIISGGIYNGIDVGGLDNFLGSSSSLPNSNPTSEENFVNSLIGPPDTTFVVKSASDINYFKTTTANIFAVNLIGTPAYFVLKNARFWAAYENVANVGWAVFDVSLLDPSMNLGKNGNAGTISHVSEFGEAGDDEECPNCPPPPPPPEVPEPGALALLAIGLLGLGAARRRLV
jgi:hypothetical protein